MVAVLSLTCLWAEQSQFKAFFRDSSIVEGFSIVVGDEMASAHSTPDQTLYCGVKTISNEPKTVYLPLQPEFACQIDLFATNGVAMPKTKLGEKFGVNFFDLDPSPSKIRTKVKGVYASKTTRPGAVLFRPEDLFEFKKPGDYTLKIRFQIIVPTKTGTNRDDYTYRVIRFPSMDYPLLKPDTVPKKP